MTRWRKPVSIRLFSRKTRADPNGTRFSVRCQEFGCQIVFSREELRCQIGMALGFSQPIDSKNGVSWISELVRRPAFRAANWMSGNSRCLFRTCELRCQIVFSCGGRPRRRGSRAMPRRWDTNSTQSSAPNGRPLRSDARTASKSLAGCSARTLRRQRARRSGSVRPSCSHSGNESRRGSACPAPWQRWLDQG
jgi:hypothetical protein